MSSSFQYLQVELAIRRPLKPEGSSSGPQAGRGCRHDHHTAAVMAPGSPGPRLAALCRCPGLAAWRLSANSRCHRGFGPTARVARRGGPCARDSVSRDGHGPTPGQNLASGTDSVAAPTGGHWHGAAPSGNLNSDLGRTTAVGARAVVTASVHAASGWHCMIDSRLQLGGGGGPQARLLPQFVLLECPFRIILVL